MKKLLTLAVLFLAGAAMADQNWVRVIVEPNWNLGDNSPGPGSGGMYTVYYAPTNGWGNTAEEILPKLKLYSPKEFEENFTKLKTPAATYSRNDQQYTFTGYGATIDPTKAYFTVILCDGGTNYGYYYRVIDSHLSNYDQFLSGEPNEKCAAHLSFGYFYKIDIAYAFTTVTDEAGEETYISYMTDWDQGKLEQTWNFVPGEPRTFSTAEFATAAAAKFNANPREWIKIPTGLENADEETLTTYCNMFVATASDKVVTLNLTESAREVAIPLSVTNAVSDVFAAFVDASKSAATLTGVVPGVYYAIQYGADKNSLTKLVTGAATSLLLSLPVPEDVNPKQFAFRVVASAEPITAETIEDENTSIVSEVTQFSLSARGVNCASEVQAQLAANAINNNLRTMVTIPEELANAEGVTEDDLSAYCKMFGATVSGTQVMISLTPEARKKIQDSTTAVMTSVVDAFVKKLDSVTLTGVVPGVYYAVKYGADENLGTSTTPVLATGTSATGTSVTLAIPEGKKPNPAKFAFRVWASFTTETESSASGVQLWEGGPYWAECNVGATTPEDAGYYFRWGDTTGYTYEDGTWVSSSGTQSSTFSVAACPTYKKSLASHSARFAREWMKFSVATGGVVL